MKKKFFGTDGIRGEVGQGPITPEFMLKLGWAVGKALGARGNNTVLIGKDTRISGYMFESVLEAGLTAAGVNVSLLGVMPTPGIAYLTRTLHASAGIVISASHNAYQDNGIKFFGSGGRKLSDKLELEIEAMLDSPMSIVESGLLGKAGRIDDARGRYIEQCKSTIPATTDLRGLKLVIDCAHGATYGVAPSVFTELGAEVIATGVSPNGLNINLDCGSTKPDILTERVLAESADLGIAFDGDGDRVIMVDRHGRAIDGDELLYVIASDRLACGALVPAVVGTQMSNLGLEKALASLGITLLRAKVGDRHVMQMLKKNHLMLGGEGSGHIVCLDRTTTGDGIVSSLQVLAAMMRSGQGLDELVAGMNKYPQTMINVPVSGSTNYASSEPVRRAVSLAEEKLGDEGRVLLRPSGTEPVVRVMVEGADEHLVRNIAGELAEVVGQALAA